jgi:predicted HTH domain antitoxin
MVEASDKKEIEHIINVLRNAQHALKEGNAFELQQLSDQTIHSASIEQHTDSITIAVLMYTLNKILSKKNKINIKKWEAFVIKFNLELEKAISELKKRDIEEFVRHLEHAKDLLKNASSSLKTNIQEVLNKAALNKASRIYEHGISLSQTSRLLDVTQWELAEYIGQRSIPDNPYNATVDIKKRAKVTLDFFSS